MNTLLVAFALAIAGMNGESNSTTNNVSIESAIIAGSECRIDLTNIVDDPGFTKRQLEMRSLEFSPRSFSGRTMIG